MSKADSSLSGTKHWVDKHGVKLFLWNKCAVDPAAAKGVVLFVHRSSMPGRPNSSAMDFFAGRGYDTWAVEWRAMAAPPRPATTTPAIACGAEDCFPASSYIRNLRGARPLMVYGISSGALRAALFARTTRRWYQGLPSTPWWTGETARRGRAYQTTARIPRQESQADRPRLSAFDLLPGHPTTSSADENVVDAFADQVFPLDDSVPTGTYVDMCANLPVVDPTNIRAATIIMRGQWDGIASVDDLLDFFKLLPNPDKQFAVMPGISHASFHCKNYEPCLHILLGFFSRPEPVYQG